MLRMDLVDPTMWKEKLLAWFCFQKWWMKLWTNSEICNHTIGETSLKTYTIDSYKPWIQAVSCNVFMSQNKNMSQKFLSYLKVCFLRPRPTKRRSRTKSCSLTWPPSFDHYNLVLNKLSWSAYSILNTLSVFGLRSFFNTLCVCFFISLELSWPSFFLVIDLWRYCICVCLWYGHSGLQSHFTVLPWKDSIKTCILALFGQWFSKRARVIFYEWLQVPSAGCGLYAFWTETLLFTVLDTSTANSGLIRVSMCPCALTNLAHIFHGAAKSTNALSNFLYLVYCVAEPNQWPPVAIVMHV
jgi:hypothetical protein